VMGMRNGHSLNYTDGHGRTRTYTDVHGGGGDIRRDKG